MDLHKIASHIIRGASEDEVLRPRTEYSCQIELYLTADFEGQIDKDKLLRKVKNEIVAALKVGLSTVANDLDLQPVGARVKPISITCSMNDVRALEEDIEEVET